MDVATLLGDVRGKPPHWSVLNKLKLGVLNFLFELLFFMLPDSSTAEYNFQWCEIVNKLLFGWEGLTVVQFLKEIIIIKFL